MNIVLLGAPGAGKDTLAFKFNSQYNYQILTTGALYRKEYEAKTPFGLEAHSYWGNGNLCPDDMTNELMRRTVSDLSDKTHLVFNGYPRTVEQAKFLEQISQVNIVFDLIVSEENAVQRLLGRGRIDDTEEIIKQRFRVYKNNNVDIVNFYKENKIYHELNSDGNEQDVFSSALKTILTVY